MSRFSLSSVDICVPLGHGHFDAKQNGYEDKSTVDSTLRKVKDRRKTVSETQHPPQIL